MSDPADSPKPLPLALSSEEARMRQALGLHADKPVLRPAPRREPDGRSRRFVKDGEVPVVVLGAPKDAAAAPASSAASNRLASLEGELRSERAKREKLEQSLREAHATIERLETKLAHSELAHGEALAGERLAREQAERALAEAREALQAREAATSAPERAGMRAHESAEKPRERAVAKKRQQTAAAKREPQPVKWWLPSFRAKMRKK